MRKKFIILDFGSQYTWLLARSFRELGFYSEVFPFCRKLSLLKKEQPLGFVLSGGPHSVFEPGAPRRSIADLVEIAPCLGICYGMQLICRELGGAVSASPPASYGREKIFWKESLIPQLKTQEVWMSHGDSVLKLPPGFKLLAQSSQNIPCAFRNTENNIWAFQFHPEVQHTKQGKTLLRLFAEDVCNAQAGAWSSAVMLAQVNSFVKNTLPKNEKVLCALSGGVDSTVTAVLMTKILGKKRVLCQFIDTGLLRENEFDEVLNHYKKLDLNIQGIQAENDFLSKLKGVSDPEEKRKIIGRAFIDVFKKNKSADIQWLAQGTLYPDVIESVSPKGPSAVIKSHHNVGGLPKNLNLKLIEPLRFLFKDEVRRLGKELGLQGSFLHRHPFPGPGLAVRIMGEVAKESLNILRKADAVFIHEIKKAGLYDQIWQAFCILLKSKAVGVQGDARTYQRAVALRAVVSTDGMTADWFSFSPAFLKSVSNKITNQVREINRVVYDITAKPPGTIEWE